MSSVVMKSLSKKKTGWVNVYKYDDGSLVLGDVLDTKEKSMSVINTSLIYVDTIKIEWRE